MAILLLRVDERLIHGQVTVGWGNQLKPERYCVVDDTLPGSDFERDLYRLGTPAGVEADFLTVDAARMRLAEWRDGRDRIVVLTRDLDHMLRLAEGGGLRGTSINLGGLHHRPGRTRVLSYLYLDDEDRRRVGLLVEQGVEVSAQDLPGAPVTPAQDLVNG